MNYLVLEPNYCKIVFFFKKFVSNRNEKNETLINKPLHMVIQEINKAVMQEACYWYVKTKYGGKKIYVI